MSNRDAILRGFVTPERQTDKHINSKVQESRFTTDLEQDLGASAAHEPRGSIWSGKGPLESRQSVIPSTKAPLDTHKFPCGAGKCAFRDIDRKRNRPIL